MKTSQEPQGTPEVQPSSEASHDLQGDHQNSPVVEAPKAESGSASVASSNSRKVSREDIELVQNLIERCLQLYMNRGEVVRTLSSRARIEPGFTTLVWQKLEEENSEFFRAYYIRLKLKKQIILFNHLLEHQYHLMKYPVQPKVPLTPIQNGIHHMPVQLIYLWGIQFCRSTQCQLQFSLMLTPWVVDCPAVMWSMVFLLQAVFIPSA